MALFRFAHSEGSLEGILSSFANLKGSKEACLIFKRALKMALVKFALLKSTLVSTF